MVRTADLAQGNGFAIPDSGFEKNWNPRHSESLITFVTAFDRLVEPPRNGFVHLTTGYMTFLGPTEERRYRRKGSHLNLSADIPIPETES